MEDLLVFHALIIDAAVLILLFAPAKAIIKVLDFDYILIHGDDLPEVLEFRVVAKKLSLHRILAIQELPFAKLVLQRRPDSYKDLKILLSVAICRFLPICHIFKFKSKFPLSQK